MKRSALLFCALFWGSGTQGECLDEKGKRPARTFVFRDSSQAATFQRCSIHVPKKRAWQRNHGEGGPSPGKARPTRLRENFPCRGKSFGSRRWLPIEGTQETSSRERDPTIGFDSSSASRPGRNRGRGRSRCARLGSLKRPSETENGSRVKPVEKPKKTLGHVWRGRQVNRSRRENSFNHLELHRHDEKFCDAVSPDRRTVSVEPRKTLFPPSNSSMTEKIWEH